jgi:Proton-conducting membrane transporter
MPGSVIILAVIVVALGGGLATILLTPLRRPLARAVGIVTALATALLAAGIPIADTGGAVLTGTDLLRLLAVDWAFGTLVLGLLEVEIGRQVVVTGPALVGLAVAVLALAVQDPATAFAALAGGGLTAILIPSLRGWMEGRSDPARLRTAIRGTWAVLASGLIGVAVIAWAASPVGPLANGPPAGDPGMQSAAGLALLGIVAAVAIRAGAIPAHVWAARFIEGVSPLAVPAGLVWGPATFTLVALGWAQVAVGPATTGGIERAIIVAVALASILLGGLAAIIHDDLEHVLGYSILQDAGVAILAFASLHTEAADAAADWLIASAMLKTALAAWVAGMRSTFGAHRLADLRGWMRRSPGLAVAFGFIAVGAVGVPGMALFAARVALVDGVVGGIAGTLLLLVALTPIVYLGRILAVGTGPATAAVAAAPSPRPSWSGGREPGWSGRPIRVIVRALPAELRANRVPILAVGVLVLAVMGFGVAVGGVVT